MPAVEAMQVLAASVRQVFPDTDIRLIKDASFDKFLYIEPGMMELAAMNVLTRYDNGDIVARLTTRVRSDKLAISRIKEHAVIRFSSAPETERASGQGCKQVAKGEDFPVSPAAIYRELVPFGASYHNITKPLLVSKAGAVAEIHAPEADGLGTLPDLLGSPFPLDAAFHAACVWGQRFYGIVAFPVGFARRAIFRPTRTGETYWGVVTPVQTKDVGCLLFNIRIETLAGDPCEAVNGVRMRDVSAGRMKPPEWIVRRPLERAAH